MIQLQDKENGEVLGSITEDDLQFLIDNLEEESEDEEGDLVTQDIIDQLLNEDVDEEESAEEGEEETDHSTDSSNFVAPLFPSSPFPLFSSAPLYRIGHGDGDGDGHGMIPTSPFSG